MFIVFYIKCFLIYLKIKILKVTIKIILFNNGILNMEILILVILVFKFVLPVPKLDRYSDPSQYIYDSRCP